MKFYDVRNWIINHGFIFIDAQSDVLFRTLLYSTIDKKFSIKLVHTQEGDYYGGIRILDARMKTIYSGDPIEESEFLELMKRFNIESN